jgi:hypothetical protein
MDEKTDKELGAKFRCWLEYNGLLQERNLDLGGPQVERFIRRERSQ